MKATDNWSTMLDKDGGFDTARYEAAQREDEKNKVSGFTVARRLFEAGSVAYLAYDYTQRKQQRQVDEFNDYVDSLPVVQTKGVSINRIEKAHLLAEPDRPGVQQIFGVPDANILRMIIEAIRGQHPISITYTEVGTEQKSGVFDAISLANGTVQLIAHEE